MYTVYAMRGIHKALYIILILYALARRPQQKIYDFVKQKQKKKTEK